MNLRPILSRLANYLGWRSQAPRSLQDRANELTNTLGQFLPRSMALGITARVFKFNPGFDLHSSENELIRYLLNQAIQDFRSKVEWLIDNASHAIAMAWVRAVRDGRELFFPTYLQGCFDLIGEDEDDHRGGGR